MPIRITPGGIVEVARQTEQGTWRTTIAPGDMAEAQKILDADELKQVQAVWTVELVQAWRDAHPEPPTQTEPQPPSAQERIAELEGALIELATTGKLSVERRSKLERPHIVRGQPQGA